MLRFCGWHSKGCERATRAIGGVQSSMRATTVIMRYCDQPASRVGIQLVVFIGCTGCTCVTLGTDNNVVKMTI